ncbi:MAG: ABC transporter substrate-binding protein [Chloroflexi bacterium]|nr:ABC transporter substrate-binding protein [Chloroflexota bacterium]
MVLPVLMLLALTVAGCGGPRAAGAPAGAAAESPAAPPGAPPSRLVKFGLPSVALSYMPIYIADEQGLFAAHGLRAEIVTMASDAAPVAAMQGEIDFGGSAPSAIDLALRGGTVKLVMGLFDTSPWTLIARPDVQTGADLRGQIIAVGGPNPRAFALAGVRHLGLDPSSEVNLLNTGGTSNSLTALLSGQVAAAVVTPPYDAKAKAQGFHELLFLGDLIDFPYVALPTSQRTLDERPALVRDALLALLRAQQWWREHPAETIAAIAERFQVSEAEAADAYAVFSRIMSPEGMVKESSVRAYLQAQGEAEAAAGPLDRFIDHRPLQEAQRLLGLSQQR